MVEEKKNKPWVPATREEIEELISSFSLTGETAKLVDWDIIVDPKYLKKPEYLYSFRFWLRSNPRVKYHQRILTSWPWQTHVMHLFLGAQKVLYDMCRKETMMYDIPYPEIELWQEENEEETSNQ